MPIKRILIPLCLLVSTFIFPLSKAPKILRADTNIAPPAAVEKYNRANWKHWIDADGDGQDTRQEVLIEESLIPPTLSADGRKVITGLWVCPYTGETNTDPAKLDVDHVVPLKNANDTGGAVWDKKK